MFRPAVVWCIIAALVALVASPVRAQPAPSVNSPAVSVQRGQTLDLAVGGANLATVTSIGMRDPSGLDVSLAKPEKDAKPNDGQARLKVVAAPDAAPGEREVRLISPTGVSNPLRLIIEQYPLLSDAEPNNTPQQAQSAPLPAVLIGRIEARGDADCFRFEARKGQHLVFDVVASRSGSPLDAAVAVYDGSGKEIASDNDTHGADPFVAFDVPADGAYVIEIRDLQYRGGGDYGYRIQSGAIPYVEAIVPMTSQRGRVVEVQAVGHNLSGADKIKLDLTYAQRGRVSVRAQTPLGMSNALPFEVTDAPPVIEAEPNDAPQQAAAVTLPAEISGRIERGDDEDSFKFTIAQKQMVNIEVTARRFGSPLDALLTLKNGKDGAAIETNDDAAGADARITRELDPGDYVVSVRDLVYSGGAEHAYRLSIDPTLSPPQGFSLRFQPDTIRLHRGGNVAMWCDVSRQNGFSGDVTVTLEGLPRGVTAPPVAIGPGSSGYFTISAAPDANLGSAPLRLRGSALVGGSFVALDAQPESKGRAVQEAYLTVLEPAPFTVETLVGLDPQKVGQYAGEVAALTTKLSSPDPRLDAAQAEWEKKASAAAMWTVVDIASASSSDGATLEKQPDGSVLARGATPERDIYTVVGHTDAKGIRAIRLELMLDGSLPQKGPGRAPNGNLVVTRFLVTAAPKASPSNTTPVKLLRPRADFEQSGYPVRNAIDSDEQGDVTGWAIAPEMSKPHTAIFYVDPGIGGAGGTRLTFVMDHQFGQQHTVGRFRISVNTDPNAADVPVIPESIAVITKVPAGQRTPEQKAQLADYYRNKVDLQMTADRARLEALRTLVAPQAEAARLESVLNAQTPQLDAEMAQWARRVVAGSGWAPLDLAETESEGGATLSKDPDGSLVVTGAGPAVDNYKLTATSPLRGITAVRLEVLPDPRLPENGPGRGAGGNFILTRFGLATAPKANPAQATPVELHSPQVSVEQAGWTIAGALDDRSDTGWGIGGYAGRPAVATFFTRAQVPGGDENVLTVTLEHQAAAQPRHALGRFRVWATNALDPSAAPQVPDRILSLLKNEKRGERENAELAAYYRAIAPSLEPVRQRLAELRSRVGPGRPVVARNQGGAIPVVVNRRNGFVGDVTVTLVGFSPGREGNGPRPIERDLNVKPVTVAGSATFATLGFQVDGGSMTGTKMAVLRAEAKVGNDTVVQYSPAFPMTVQ